MAPRNILYEQFYINEYIVSIRTVCVCKYKADLRVFNIEIKKVMARKACYGLGSLTCLDFARTYI